MGLFDFLSPLATTATQAVGAQRAGQTAANARVTDDAFERAKLLMAMRNQQQEQDFRNRTLANTTAYDQARIKDINDRVGGQPTSVRLPSPADALAATIGPSMASATAPTASAGTVTVPSLPRDVREANLRAAASSEAIAQRGAQQRETQAAKVPAAPKPITPRFIPGAAPGTVATPTAGGGFQASLIAGVTPKPPAAAGGGRGAAVANAQLNRQKDYVDLMVSAAPKMLAAGGQLNPIDKAGVSSLLTHPLAANYVASDRAQSYTVFAKNFLAGVLHEESGARLSDSQIKWGIGRYIVVGGDSPSSIAAKNQNIQATIEARKKNAGWVPPDAPLSDEGKANATAAAGASGNISLGPTPPQRDMATWAAKNPPKPGESRDAYRARYQAGGG